MNRFNNKLYYKPPPVKISKKLKNEKKTEWNSYQSDLDKYKLSNAEIIKKKINAVSKNLNSAKKDWQENLLMMQSGKYNNNYHNLYTEENNNKKYNTNKKIDLRPANRFEKLPPENSNNNNIHNFNNNVKINNIKTRAK